MTFQSPLLLLTLLALPLAVLVLGLVQRRRRRYAVRYTNLDVLAGVAARGGAWRRYLAAALFLAAVAALCVGVARPRASTLVTDERATVVLVIDVSRSMQADDVKPSRLAAAQEAAQIFLRRTPSRLRVGLVVFAGEAVVAAPPTRDHDFVRRSIDLIDTSSAGFGGTAIGDAIARAVQLGRQTVTGERTVSSTSRAAARGLVSILFLSDGRQNRGILPPLQGAALAKAAGIPVYTVALGTGNGGSGGGFGRGGGQGFGGGPFGAPDPATLKAIANATGGEFTRARNAKTVKAAYAKLGSRLGRVHGEREITFALVAGAAVLLAAAGAVAVVRSPGLP
jgi:Ca-activated chloride channel homolog